MAQKAAIVAELVVEAGTYVDRNLATASWWDKHELIPGVYPMWLTDVNYNATPYSTNPYYVTVSVPTIVVEEYRVNRIFQHERACTDTPNRPGKAYVTMYGYNLRDADKALDGHAYVRLLADHVDRHHLMLRAENGRLHSTRRDEPVTGPVRAHCACGWETDTPDTVEAAKAAFDSVHLVHVTLCEALRWLDTDGE